MLHGGYERSACINSGKKYFNEKKSTYRGVNSRNTTLKNHTDPTVVINNGSRKQKNGSPQLSTLEAANIPTWFKNYMDKFHHQVTTDVTQNIINDLDASLNYEITRGNHKYSYFALKRRYKILERELKQVREHNNVQKSKIRRILCENTSQNASKKQGTKNTTRDQKGMPTNESNDRVTNFISPRVDKRKKKSANQNFLNSSTNSTSIDNQGHTIYQQNIPKIVNKNDKQFSENKNNKVIKYSENKSTLKTKKNQQTEIVEKCLNDVLTIERTTTEKCLKNTVENKKSLDVKLKYDDNKNNSELLYEEESHENSEIQIDNDKKKNVLKDIEDIEKNLIEMNISVDDEIKNDNSDEKKNKPLESKANESDLNGFVAEVQDILTSLNIKNNQNLEKEVENFKNLTKDDMKSLTEFFLDKTKNKLSDSLTASIKKIADLNPGLNSVNLLPESFIETNIQQFTNIKTINNVEHLSDFLDIVDESSDFWENYDCLNDLKKIV